MKHKVFIKIISVLTAILCIFSAVNPITTAAVSDADFMTVDSITICERHGIVEGEKIKLTASLMPETAFESSVKWRSSDESVVSCTEDGVITGKTPGGYAYIYCESKWGDVSDKIKVYCAEKVSHTVRSNLKGYVNFIYSAPNPLAFLALHINLNNVLKMFFDALSLFSFGVNSSSTVNAASGSPIAMGKCEIKGKISSYAFISFKSGEFERDGFILFSKFEETAGLYPTLSAKDMNVWGDGIAYDGKTLTTKYNGTVSWKVADDTVAEFNETTGQVTGLKPGVTTITVTTADGLSETCTVHSLYKWPQTWTTQTNQDTYLYRAEGSEYKEDKTLKENKAFIVYGDEGSSDGWAYGNISGTETWGYIPISHISKKGTVSQYSGLGWVWPVRDVKNGVAQATKARYITSPYGWRDTDPARHKGVDITNGVSSNSDFANSVDGYEVVSAFAGKVIFVHDNSTGYKSCGNCVAIRSNEKDPITGKHYIAIYMHLKSVPIVGMYADISANQKIGYVGNTGNSGGSHLHFEVNNQNLSYGQQTYYENNSDKEMVFGSVINPLFFYIKYYNLPESNSDKIKINPTCDAMNYRKPLWYGDDIKESKKP